MSAIDRPARSRVPVLSLFSYDWDASGFAALEGRYRIDHAGFDLFSFPSQLGLFRFDLQRFTDRLARQARARGWQAVVSHHEQFGALAAALLAERMGWPGTSVQAVLACQHKLAARAVLQQVAPEANLASARLDACYGGAVPERLPEGLSYPVFAKPVKAAFSVLAKRIVSQQDLHRFTRFGAYERWIIEQLVEPFERVCRERLPEAGSAHAMMLEQPVVGAQYNLDGYVEAGVAHAVGVVDAVMYPGTQAFMRWDLPSRLPSAVQRRALDVASRFLRAIGYTQGCFNMEFFHDAATDKLSVIEFNPRMASQFADLYRRTLGLDLHAMSIALALGEPAGSAPRTVPTAGAASSFVFRSFDPAYQPRMPGRDRQRALSARFPDALLLPMPKSGHGLRRDFKWLGSHRYGILHLGGDDADDLRQRCESACAMIGWPAPYADVRAPGAYDPALTGLAPDSHKRPLQEAAP
jgi:hypothetical protein